MGLTKSAHFTEQQNELANIAKALGHPARIAIVEYLLKVNVCISGDIVGELPLAQPTISQHLKELRSAGIIKGSVEGASVCYCLDNAKLELLSLFLGKLVSHTHSLRSKCC